MKIINLQEIGQSMFAKSIRLDDFINDDFEGPIVTKIEMEEPDEGWGQSVYVVYTDDGHYRVVPADKYIAEYAKD
ncbi:MAG: hypothetical protein ABF899_01505 [Oenococcus sp.]|uniref:hypothetical protein n=1 Tax=Oenococcus sp. TaxID=1979414 RepID=UPI0039EBA17F